MNKNDKTGVLAKYRTNWRTTRAEKKIGSGFLRKIVSLRSDTNQEWMDFKWMDC